jgi:branched-chain amino acid transport system permease protein
VSGVGAVEVTAPSATATGALRTARPWLVLAGAALGGLALQTQLYTGQQRTVTTVLMFVGLAAGWNLIGGFCGYPSFGHVGFFGLGGYTAAVAMVHLHLSFWVALALAVPVAAVPAALCGLLLLRLRGHYFAVATLGVAEGLREIVLNAGELTGGGAGITLPSTGSAAVTPWLGNDGFYLLFLALATVAVAVNLGVARGRSGYALRAVNQDEDSAASVGINTTVAKTAAFAGSAALAGALGAAYAFQQVTIYPDRLFDVDLTVLTIVMVVLGGAGTVAGPAVGAVVVGLASEWLRSRYPTAHTFVLGGLIITAVVVLPQGLVAYAGEVRRTRRLPLLDNVRRYRL